jgi:hypothetical protein
MRNRSEMKFRFSITSLKSVHFMKARHLRTSFRNSFRISFRIKFRSDFRLNFRNSFTSFLATA